MITPGELDQIKRKALVDLVNKYLDERTDHIACKLAVQIASDIFHASSVFEFQRLLDWYILDALKRCIVEGLTVQPEASPCLDLESLKALYGRRAKSDTEMAIDKLIDEILLKGQSPNEDVTF